MAYIDEGKEVELWTPELPLPSFLVTEEPIKLGAHNAQFEYFIWNNCGVPKYGFHKLENKNIICSAALAAAYSLPRALDKAGEVLKLKDQKSRSGKMNMLKLCKGLNYPKDFNFEDEKYLRKMFDLGEYCKQDVISEKELSSVLPKLKSFEEKVFLLDQKINETGVFIDLPSVEKIIKLIEEYTCIRNKEVELITEGEFETTTRVLAVIKWISNMGYSIPDLTKDTVEKALLDNQLPLKARAFLEIRQQLGQSSTKKYQTLFDTTDLDNRARGYLLYNGASTGRWSGKHFQPQNIPRGTIKNVDTALEAIHSVDLDGLGILYGENIMGMFSSCLRAMITAPNGYDLMVADYASIEARVLLWLANDEAGLQLFRNDQDLYVDMASNIFNIPFNKIDKQQRTLGKIAILGLGYGMGAKKFKETCSYFGIEIEKDLADTVVSKYRAKYSSIVKFWKDLEKLAYLTILNKRKYQCKNISSFIDDKGSLVITLPSGRNLIYPFACLKEVDSPYGKKKVICFGGIDSKSYSWREQNTYGGKLAENVTQAVARDILAEALVRLDETGYKIVLHVHDEIVCEMLTDKGCMKEFISLMCTSPTWASGLPIKAEGWRGKRYRK